MTEPLQKRVSITLDELKELEPDFAEVIDKVGLPLYPDIDWLVTKLYLTAYQQGYLRGCSDERIATDNQWLKAIGEPGTLV